jgi:2-polyprenyl-3-methyl-5-hydroxy-6-metoxy-1,4-benzoquinol methylase
MTEDYFGDPYPELINFLSGFSPKGKLLDLGCGQGRDSIPLARLGYKVTGIDSSFVGIGQMLEIAQGEGLDLEGIVGDIYNYKGINKFDIILLDSMFHFTRKDRKKEIGYLKDVVGAMKPDAMLVICLHNMGAIYKTFSGVINQFDNLVLLKNQDFSYTFNDPDSDHRSVVPYIMLAYIKKEDL